MNILQRLPQSTKILIAGLLLVAGVTTWYLAIFRPSQQPTDLGEPTPPVGQPVQVETPPAEGAAMATKPAEGTGKPEASTGASGAASATPPAGAVAAPAKPLEVLPVPFLKSEAAATPEKSGNAKPAVTPAKPVTAAAPRPRIQVPPNPFVPLVVEEPLVANLPGSTPGSMLPPTATNPIAPTVRPATVPTPRTMPVQQQRVQVRPPVAQLPKANFPQVRNTPTSRTPVAATPQTTVRQAQTPVQVQLPKPVQPRPRLIQPNARLGSTGQPVSGLATGALPIRLNPLSREIPILPPLSPVVTPEVSPPVAVPEASRPTPVETTPAPPAPVIINPEPPAPAIKTEPTVPVAQTEPPAPVVKAEPPAPVTKTEPPAPVAKVDPPAPPVVTQPTPPAQPVVTGADQGILQGGPTDGGKGLDLVKVELQPQGVQRPEVRRTAPVPVRVEPPKVETKPVVAPEVKPETKPLTEVKPEVKPETKPEVKPETKPEIKPQAQVETKPEVKPEAVETALAKYVREGGLRLVGVVLGPTSVAIFQYRNGEHLVLPVGRTLPDSEILLKSLNAREALLVRGSESLNLELQQTN